MHTAKRFWICLLCFVLSLFSGVSAMEQKNTVIPETIAENIARDIPPAEDFIYTSISITEYVKNIGEQTLCVAACASEAEALSLAEENHALRDSYSTMLAYAQLQYDMGGDDAYWEGELDALLLGKESLDAAFFAFDEALFLSEYGEAVEAAYGSAYFAALENPSANASEEVKELWQREEELLEQYETILYEARISYQNTWLTLEDIYYLEDDEAYFDAYVQWHTQYNEELAAVFADVITTRNAYARLLGYADYPEYAFAALGRDYTPEMAGEMTEHMVEYLAPLARDVDAEGFAPADIFLSLDELIPLFREQLETLEPLMAATLDAMLAHGYCFAQEDPRKADAAYVNYLPQPGTPFLFMNYMEDEESIANFIHEFGHFYENYLMGEQRAHLEDISEIHAQALALIMANRYGLMFGQEAGYAMGYNTLYATLDFAVYFSYNTHRALELYSMDEDLLTAESMNQAMLKASEEYRFAEYYETAPLYAWASDWELFAEPFASFSYATSAQVAMQLYILWSEEEQEGLDAYHSLILCEGSRNALVASVEAAGLVSPFAEESYPVLENAYRGMLVRSSASTDAA